MRFHQDSVHSNLFPSLDVPDAVIEKYLVGVFVVSQ
jgi:hypothetical protein